MGTDTASFSPAIQLLSAILKDRGIDVSLVHLNNPHMIPDDKSFILAEIKKHNPNVIGFTATSFQFTRANKIAGYIKKEYPRKTIILGGTHATIKPEDLRESNFDAFCIGEGDEALPEFLEKIASKQDHSSVNNFHVKLKDGTIKKNPIRPFIKDLNFLPHWDMNIMDMPKLIKIRKGWLSISFSRGCPYRCAFCINPLLLKLNVPEGECIEGYCRKRSVDNVINELVIIIEKFKGSISVINFDDDLLMLDRAWILAFTEKYMTRIFHPHNIQYVFNCRANTIDHEIAQALSRSGCLELRIGLETGDETLRNTILNKRVSNDELRRAFSIADQHGIHTNAFVMLGLPGESQPTINATLKLIADIRPFLIRMTFLYPYYRTQIYDYCVKHNLIKPEYYTLSNSFTESPLRFHLLDDNNLLSNRLFFPWYANLLICDDPSIYLDRIWHYGAMKLKQLRQKQTFKNILNDDKALSQTMTKREIPHYKYFSDNRNYFHLKGKYGFN